MATPFEVHTFLHEVRTLRSSSECSPRKHCQGPKESHFQGHTVTQGWNCLLSVQCCSPWPLSLSLEMSRSLKMLKALSPCPLGLSLPFPHSGCGVLGS